jgi:hypothetical protein
MVSFKGQKLFQMSLIFFKLIVSPMHLLRAVKIVRLVPKAESHDQNKCPCPFVQKKQFTVVVMPFI